MSVTWDLVNSSGTGQDFLYPCEKRLTCLLKDGRWFALIDRAGTLEIRSQHARVVLKDDPDWQ